MRISIHDKSGEVEVVEEEEPAIAAALAQAALLRWHATRAHDTFELRIEGDDETHTLQISCPQCRVTQEQELEPWFVGAAALAFHTSHEGHPLRIEYAGRVLTSPPRNSGHATAMPIGPMPNAADGPFVKRMKELATATICPLKVDRARYSKAAHEFTLTVTEDWVRDLMGQPDLHITRVRVKTLRGNSGVNEEGQFLLYTNVAIQIRDEVGDRKLVFPYVEVFGSPPIPDQG
jgi:hypothetical protein